MHHKKQINFDEIVKLVNSPLKAGTIWYILSKKWYDTFKAYHETGDECLYPCPIDNSELFDTIKECNCLKARNGFSAADSTTTTTSTSTTTTPTSTTAGTSTNANDLYKWIKWAPFNRETRALHIHTAENEDFILMPEECWNLLKDAYGVAGDDHAMPRQVVEPSPGQTLVELAPVNLKLCLYGGREATIEKEFSRAATVDELHQEIRKAFNISSERESKLWIQSKVYGQSGAVLKPSKSENNLQTKQPIKAPPTPPPMPSSNSTNSVSSPTVMTRQAENLLNANKRPVIALPDSTTSLNTRSSASSANNKSSTENNEPKLSETLAEAGVGQDTVITLEVVNGDGTWPSSRPRYGTVTTRSTSSLKTQPGLCGLSNMGNTCFMNSALQCLSNTTPLTDYILTDKFLEDINTNNPLGMHGEIARTYAELIKVIWSGNSSSFLPREFKCAVSRFAPQFNGFAQQDCQELMAFLLDGLHEDLNRIRNKPYIELKNDIDGRPDEVVAVESWSNYKRRNDSIVVDTFHGMLKSTLVCPGCKLVSVTFDPFCYLSLPLPTKRERSVLMTFMRAPRKIDESKLKTVFDMLSPEEVETIKQYGGRISSFDSYIEEYGCYAPTGPMLGVKKLSVPLSGSISEICEIVADVINEASCPVKVDDRFVADLVEKFGKDTKKDQLSSSRSINDVFGAIATDGNQDSVLPVKADNLLVAEYVEGKIQKVYGSDERYTNINGEILVIEKASKYAIPLFIVERKSITSRTGTVIHKPAFLHVPDLKFETLYKSVVASLSNLTPEYHESINTDPDRTNNWLGLALPTKIARNKIDSSRHVDHGHNGDAENEMEDCNETLNGDSDDDVDSTVDSTGDGDEKMDTTTSDSDLKVNGSTSSKRREFKDLHAIDLSITNSFGNYLTDSLGLDSKECVYSSRLYLAASFTQTTLSMGQFIHLTRKKVCEELITYFYPKVTQLKSPPLQLKDCIAQFTSVERLGAHDLWYCPKCKQHQQATKKFDIWSLPNVLIIHLKRFSYSRSWRDKIDTLVEFPVEGLDMSEHVLNPDQKNRKKLSYNLIAVANHYGGLGGGHYTAYAWHALTKSWYTFDDATVSKISSSDAVTRSAYVLFYQLQEDSQN